MTKTTKIIAALGVVAGLGVASLPLSSYAAASVSGNAKVNVTVTEAISMTIKGTDSSSTTVDQYSGATSGTDNLTGNTINAGPASSSTPIAPNSKVEGTASTFASKVTVYTNDTAGYKLTVKGATAELKNGSYTIPASATIAAGTSAWAFQGGDITAWTAMKTTDQTIKSSGTKTTGGEATDVLYAVSTSADQAAGTYTDTLTFTATNL